MHMQKNNQNNNLGYNLTELYLGIGLTLANMLSSYYYGLPLKVRECYLAKLLLLNGVTLDPYGLASCLWLSGGLACNGQT